MTDPVNLIDFKELVSSVRGEGLEELTRQIGHRKSLSPAWSGRGADGGRDLFFTEILSGALSKEKIKWVVSCKDKAKSNDTVTERDLPVPGIKDKLAQHGANGFLLVTTTTVSTGARALLDSLDKNNGGDTHTLVWDKSELTAILLDPANQDLLKQFLPQSYQRVKGLTSLEGAVLAFRDQLPEEILTEVMRMLRPYSSSTLKGSLIWPYDHVSATTIDQIVRNLLINEDAGSASSSTEGIEFDAFIALITKLHESYSEKCYEYLSSIICKHSDADIRYNALQFLLDNYEIPPADNIKFAARLDRDALSELYSSEIAMFIESEVMNNSSAYELSQDLELLSKETVIVDVSISNISFITELENKIEFEGTFSVIVTLNYDDETALSGTYPGDFYGYFDEHGMYLTSAVVDTKSFYE